MVAAHPAQSDGAADQGDAAVPQEHRRRGRALSIEALNRARVARLYAATRSDGTRSPPIPQMGVARRPANRQRRRSSRPALRAAIRLATMGAWRDVVVGPPPNSEVAASSVPSS